MRYSDGAYKPAPGYRFHRAAEVYEIQEMDTGVRLFVPCVPVRGLGDTSYGPAITVELTAPRRDTTMTAGTRRGRCAPCTARILCPKSPGRRTP